MSEDLFNICDQCLGDSKNVRMIKVPSGLECKICTYPFTVYKFKTSNRASNITKTLICKRCSDQRNICQCCMLDMTWHIPVNLRDQIISLINNGSSGTIVTKEAKNDIMKRYISLKDIKLGGAEFTSDPKKVQELLDNLKEELTTGSNKSIIRESTQKSTSITEKNSKYESVNITNLISKLPLSNSISESSEPTKSFFIYNIDPSIPEWKVRNRISEIINLKDWQDTSSNSLIINHKSRCGGIRFKSADLGNKFVSSLQETGKVFTSSECLIRGIIDIDQNQIFVIPWHSGFSTASFGDNIGENVKLSSRLEKFIRKERIGKDSILIDQQLPLTTSKRQLKSNKENKKKNKKPKRIPNLQL
ncbi:hypothetical protein Kpol_1065p16 [Vanderwaltozyma polyspora DSM 70294]|uniref:Pre-mRNA-splicing factor SLT11 n=1 Tax=Vanderwaltozyma polyspora (strain ATCC 22028 / DSM 70294 / BCRC 21397 / CBS 2163 / NBRC 10782 / NRRL Y-8283 / UCD 57-17) TaxID=436907 RepID=A7TL38_VANPO|nr:uncharacterized protein Kpol_1065p16 [Vanderwaltozyma polyspora DSM 70294]EDO17001.1 hypothetical protein Kpol_1065p16 [Vanderwaltozyma polyspora DSM 70294]